MRTSLRETEMNSGDAQMRSSVCEDNSPTVNLNQMSFHRTEANLMSSLRSQKFSRNLNKKIKFAASQHG